MYTMNAIRNNEQTSNKNQIYSYKMKMKIAFITFLCILILANVLTAWALPKIYVDCCEDFILKFVDNNLNKFDYIHNTNLIGSILTVLLFISDLIFIITLVKSILINFDKKFICLLSLVWLLKIFTDWSFHQHNKYDKLDTILHHFIFITSQFTHRNSLFSFPIAIQFSCYFQLHKKENILKNIIIINLCLSCVIFLIMKVFFSYQIVFSFMIVHYLNSIID